MKTISFGKIAANAISGVKVSQNSNQQIEFEQDGLHDICEHPMNNKEISPEHLIGYTDYFNPELRQEILDAIELNKQEVVDQNLREIQKEFD
jgi:hypothetical protein